MIETHPFGDFVPKNAKFLILGSFTGRQAVIGSAAVDPAYDWYYGTKRNQFWPILESVYGKKFPDKKSRQELFTKLGIAMADMIRQCERSENNNMDSNLINVVFNKSGIHSILEHNNIEKIFFSSKFVENQFRKNFKELINQYPQVELITLPSPSPRYALLSRDEKVKRYRNILPII